MTWLYTLVFTGLFISSSTELSTLNSYEPIYTTVPEVRVQKEETETFEQSYPFSATGRISVSNANGSIEVIAWDRDEIKLEATKVAETREALAEIEIKVNARPDRFSVETDFGRRTWVNGRDGKGRKLEVRYRLSVPRTAELNEIETVTGSVTVANFVNVTKISTVNGNVNASNLRGSSDLTTVNGSVNADFEQLEPGVKIDLSTVNGRVNLTLPSDANATIKADTMNGSISNSFGLPVRKGEYFGRDLYGRLGSGGAEIKLDSVNGGLAINKRNDGKSPSPSTNLLSGNSEPIDLRARDLRSTTARMRSEVRRAAVEAQREKAEALKAVSSELSKIKIADLEDLGIDMSELKIDMDVDIEKQIKDSLKIQEKVLARMQDAMFFSETPVVERKTNSFAVEQTPRVIVSAGASNVRVRGWDKSEVKYVLTGYNNVRGREQIQVKEEHTKSQIQLTVTGDDPHWIDGREPRLEIYVPRKANLKIRTEGEIRLEGVSGELDLTGGENSIDVRGADGKLVVSNTAGVVRVVDFTGDLSAKTENGEVYLDGNFDRINAVAEDGTFVVTLPPDVDAEVSSSGTLSVEGLPNGTKLSESNWRFGKGGKKYLFNSEEGTVELRSRELVNAER